MQTTVVDIVQVIVLELLLLLPNGLVLLEQRWKY
jgi:hypothetical protein